MVMDPDPRTDADEDYPVEVVDTEQDETQGPAEKIKDDGEPVGDNFA